jgi:protein-tyrosine-phosphatase
MAQQHRLFFVCTANICRSPIAEGLARALATEAGLSVESRSGGTLGWIDKPAAPNSVKVMKGLGIDISGHRSQGVELEHMDWADFVLVMEMKHASILRERFPQHNDKIMVLANFGGLYEISDPVGRWILRFRKCRDELRKCVLGFFEQLRMRQPPP